MNKILVKYSLLIGVAVLSAAALSPVMANARDGRVQTAEQTTETEDSQTTTTDQNTEDQKGVEQKSTISQMASDRKEAAQTRLTDNKLKMCQNRQKAITNITARIADRGQKQLDLFSTIAQRAEDFYATKGKTLANYDTLVADVATKKTAAEAAVSATASDSTTFKCDGTDPKGMVSGFKDSLKAEIAALKEYKTAVKNLIVGIKSVQSTTSSVDGAQQ